MTDTRTKPARAGRRWWSTRRAALISTIVVVALVAGGVSAWAVEGSGNSGYRMGGVVRASLSNSLTLVGTVEPVNNASSAFQVAGKVASVTATVGQTVTVGQTLATLDTTALTETVSSDQSSLDSAQARLIEDEDAETSSASHTSTTTTTTPSRGSTTTTTTSPNGGSASNTAAITADQNALTSDQAQTSTDQQQEAADLAQSETDCGTTPAGGSGSGSGSGSGGTGTGTGTGTGSTGACTTDLAQVSADQQNVSNDEQTVAKDEATLAKALDSDAGSGTGSGTGGSGASGTGGSGTDTTDTTGGVQSHAVSSNPAASTEGTSSPSGSGGGDDASSAASDTPEQIATDQADIDTAEANLIEAQQALSEATLTSPINGTIASVAIAVGDTVSADSSTEIIVIVGTQSYDVAGTLTSSQVPEVKVGQGADVAVDGQSDPSDATVSQVGPVEDTTDGYTYPVVATLPTSVQGLFAGSTANVTITTGGVQDVVAVPTSAVNTVGTVSYVDMLKNGRLTRKLVKVGMVGSTYTQVLSGLSPGDSVVLANLAEPVPSSNSATLGGFGGLGGGGGFGGGAGTFRIGGGTAGKGGGTFSFSPAAG